MSRAIPLLRALGPPSESFKDPDRRPSCLIRKIQPHSVVTSVVTSSHQLRH